MKLTSMLLTVAGFMILTGCDTPTPALLSLEPVATVQDTTFDAALLGAWESSDDKGTLCIIRRDDHNGYQIMVLAGSAPLGFQAQLFRIGNVELLDVIPSEDSDFRIPGHAIARIWPSADSLRWAFLDSDWLKRQTTPLAAHAADGKTLLLSPSAAVRAFISANGENDKSYGNVATWQKMQ